MNRIWKFVGIAALVAAVFVFISGNALAQDNSTDVSAEVSEDLNVTPEDLGVKDQRVLPDSPFYGFKEAWRGVKKAFTFSSEGKAKKDLEYASEKLIEAKKLSEKSGVSQEKKTEVIEQAVSGFAERVELFRERAQALGANQGSSAQELKKQAVKSNIKQNIILDQLESQVPEDVFARIKDHRDLAQTRFAETLAEFASPEDLPDFIASAVSENRGSEFGDLKALEVLRGVEDRISDQAKDAIRHARENIFNQFQDKLNRFSEEDRVNRMQDYVRQMPGDEIKRLAVLDEMKLKADLPPEILENLELMKAKTVERFNARLNEFQSSDVRDRFFKDLKKGDLSDARILDDLRVHSVDLKIREEINKHEDENFQKFRDAFSDDANAQNVADRAQKLMQQVRDNPDPKTFRLLENLRAELTPEQQNFVQNLEKAGQDEFEKRFREEPDRFLERINTANPEDFGFLDDFQRDHTQALPPEFSRKFEETIERSATQIRERVKEFERPEHADNFQNFIDRELPSEARERIRVRIPDLNFEFEKKREFFDEQRRDLERREIDSSFDGERPEFDRRSQTDLQRDIEPRPVNSLPGETQVNPEVKPADRPETQFDSRPADGIFIPQVFGIILQVIE